MIYYANGNIYKSKLLNIIQNFQKLFFIFEETLCTFINNSFLYYIYIFNFNLKKYYIILFYKFMSYNIARGDE